MAFGTGSVEVFVAAGPEGYGRRIFVRAPYAQRAKCRSLPGASWIPAPMKAWHIPATPAAAGHVLRVFAGHDLNSDAEFRILITRASNVVSAQSLRTANDLPNTPTRTDAWLHQRRAFAFAKDLDATMLAMDMGTGKSLVSLALHQEHNARLCLILCPKSVVGVWPKQFLTHALDPDEWLVAAAPMRVNVNGRVRFLMESLQRAKLRKQRLVLVTNYDSAWRPGMADLLLEQKWDEVVLDESHRVKSAGGRASMFTKALQRHSSVRRCLTGTPMPHSPMDIYAQYRFLDPGIFGTSKNRFQNRYAVMRQIKEGVNVIDGWQNLDELNEKFASIAFVVGKDEALPDLPEKMPAMERTFQLGPKAMKAYMDLAQDFVAGVESGVVVASNALTRVMRFRQITSGHAKTTEGETVHLDNGREKLLRDVLEDLDEPAVVYAAFHEDLNAIERVCEALHLRYGELSGRRRDGLTSESTMAPGIDVLGCQLKSGGVGVDFTRSSVAIYYSIGYELGDVLQSEDRLHRPGQHRPVRYIHLIAENAPIDRVMREALGERKDLVSAVMDAARQKELTA